MAKKATSEYIPTVSEDQLNIPMTLNYKGGRQESGKYKKIWLVVGIIAIVIISVGILFVGGSEVSFIQRLATSVFIFCTSTLILRFVFMHEAKIRNSMIKGAANDYRIDTYGFWGILSIDEYSPYICRFRKNGQSGVFVRMEKGVYSGNYEQSKFRHREAIGEMLNFLGDRALRGSENTRIHFSHIDCMDYVGKDERIDLLIADSKNCESPKLQATIESMYQHLKKEASKQVYASDIFVFTWRGDDDVNLKAVREALGKITTGNTGFLGYDFMSEDDLRDFYKTLFNVKNFSTVSACAKAQGNIENIGVIPIRVNYDNGGVLNINATSKEKAQEQKNKQEMRNIRKQHKKSNDMDAYYDEISKTGFLPENQGYNGPITFVDSDISDDDDVFKL